MKVHGDFVKNLKKGDSVLTTGGLLGSIDGLTEKYVILNVSEGVNVRVLRSNISSFSEQSSSPERGPRDRRK